MSLLHGLADVINRDGTLHAQLHEEKPPPRVFVNLWTPKRISRYPLDTIHLTPNGEYFVWGQVWEQSASVKDLAAALERIKETVQP